MDRHFSFRGESSRPHIMVRDTKQAMAPHTAPLTKFCLLISFWWSLILGGIVAQATT